MLSFATRLLTSGLLLAALAPAQPARKLTIELVGDSTQTDNAGYGLGFCANLTPGVVCINGAKGGASTKTYRADGLWTKALDAHPDWMLIQFGHNDMESADHLPRQTNLQTEYPANLHRYIEEARAHGIKPILVTPLTRRYFGKDGKVHSDLLPHSEAMKKVAAEDHVPLLDLQTLSIAYLDRIGEAEGNKLGITKKDASGATVPDKTHLNPAGSYAFGRIVAEAMAAAVPELAPFVIPSAAPLSAAGKKSVAILNGAPVSIALVGETAAWGPAFCATLTPNVNCGKAAGPADYHLIQYGDGDTEPALRRLIAAARAQGARPVIVTTRQVAADPDVPLVHVTAFGGRMVADGLIRICVELGPDVKGLPSAGK